MLGYKSPNRITYSNAPAWAKPQADKYIIILKECEGLKGKDLQNFVDKWNAKSA